MQNLMAFLDSRAKALNALKQEILEKKKQLELDELIIDAKLQEISESKKEAIRQDSSEDNIAETGCERAKSKKDYILQVLNDNAAPIYLDDIIDKMLQLGWETGSKSPKNAVSPVLTDMKRQGLVENNNGKWKLAPRGFKFEA